MHIPDAILDFKTCAATAALSAGVLGYAIHRVGRTFADRRAPLMGVMAATLFAAQMMNFPIPGGTSGHLLGGILAAVMLGPWSGLVVLTVVLVVQSLLMTDGGITALGANVLNVGVIGSIVGYAIFEPIRRVIGGQRGTVVGAMLAAWFTVILGATACSIELGLSGTYESFSTTLGVMLLFHSMIGLGEALITGLAIAFVLRTRPDLVYGQNNGSGALAHTGQLIVAGLSIAFVVAILFSPFASNLPDGLESTLSGMGIDTSASEPLFSAWMPDYVPRGLERFRFAGSVAGAVGTVIVFGVAFLVSLGLSSKSSAAHTPHAS